MYCDVDIYYPGKDLPGVYFLQLKHFTLIFKKRKKDIKNTHIQKKAREKKVWPYHRIFTVLYKCLQMKNYTFLVCFHIN